MTPDDTPDLTDVAAGGIALAFATGLGLTIGLAAGGRVHHRRLATVRPLGET